MGNYVLNFKEINEGDLLFVGGKGLNLGKLSRIEGIQVPEGFCVTTDAYKKIISQNAEVNTLIDQLCTLKVEDRERITEISRKIRYVIESLKIPTVIEEEIFYSYTKLGEDEAFAIRSSATAEDLPNASFAGQQDTYLNIVGKEAILKHISKCWASLFTDRAVTYRMQNNFDHRKVYLSIIIQRMVFPKGSGILFTADPVTSNRRVLSIDASFGLGEALVSGLVTADNYKVREGELIEKMISTKKIAIYALKSGGTEERELDHAQQNQQTLTDAQIVNLERMARKIESYFGSPQDIEWCLADGMIYIVQSRPITTLYPLPEKSDDQLRVYMSAGHQQMMTEPIYPLGMSFFEFMNYEVITAGGRLFIDLTHDLASPIGRKIGLKTMGKNDPLMYHALFNLLKRKQLIKSLPKGKRIFKLGSEELSWSLLVHAIKVYQRNDHSLVKQLIAKSEDSIKTVQSEITNKSGDELFAFIIEDQKQLKRDMFDPRSLGVIMTAMITAYRINKNMEKWLGEKNAADTLSQSVPDNVTSEMGLALLDVSDVVRKYPEVIAYFEKMENGDIFDELPKLEGGEAVRDSMQAFLDKYGMRCSGEIDITKTRWSEQPSLLVPVILNNIQNFEPNARIAKFEKGLLEAKAKEGNLLKRLENLPKGKKKAKKTKKMICVLRNYIGYREYPKYNWIFRMFVYKRALMKEAAKLVEKGIINEKEDVYCLSFEEFRNAVRTSQLDYKIIAERKESYEYFETLTPPRLMTSEGEVIFGEYNMENVPEGALAGIPVSSGMIEGRARVIMKMEDAEIENGDILVTAFTDPSWTPLFVSLQGLVTEVGGMMTHGAVIAREYGLPAVVGVESATKEIKDGQRIRINGTEGYVEILDETD
ncbi:phosphoenolpyruvate synthase [Virgibacillus salexigens]|uniref:phosphoenolpyruvate synthase n=1 Tax=Virgibacillus massiliensis TaxID=1462526 RepID=UPI00136B4C2C|nr:phosphoenolpyruvate synthase [Virgibacillus massiliensis]MYL42695.1 phosphoenolpyruvate synthase [Virgibacillus massiliensis]